MLNIYSQFKFKHFQIYILCFARNVRLVHFNTRDKIFISIICLKHSHLRLNLRANNLTRVQFYPQVKCFLSTLLIVSMQKFVYYTLNKFI